MLMSKQVINGVTVYFCDYCKGPLESEPIPRPLAYNLEQDMTNTGREHVCLKCERKRSK